jgi:hypothetical protein
MYAWIRVVDDDSGAVAGNRALQTQTAKNLRSDYASLIIGEIAWQKIKDLC